MKAAFSILALALFFAASSATAQEHELRLNPTTGEWELLPKLDSPADEAVPRPDESARPAPLPERGPVLYRGDAPGRGDNFQRGDLPPRVPQGSPPPELPGNSTDSRKSP